MFRRTRRGALRATAVTAAVGGLLLAGSLPAFAHVTAQPGTAQQGGYTVISMRVPTESDTASTTKLEVTFPTDHPITSARTTPQAGWTATVNKGALPAPVTVNGQQITQAVTSVVFTAAPGNPGIAPGQFVDFPISVGPLPTGVDSIMLPAAQTYSDGRVVNWNEPSTPGGAEPQHPAPTVTLTAAGATTTSTAPVAPATDTTARWLGGIGLLLGALGLGLGLGALLRGRGGKPSAAEPAKEKIDA